MSTLKRTALFETHLSSRARMVPFGDWELPIQFEGILSEAKAVRSSAGIFDVSHMGRFEISGNDASKLLDKIVTADIYNMDIGRGRYTLICNEIGGIIDDTIVYRLGHERFIMIPNAANTAAVLSWFNYWIDSENSQVKLKVKTDETSLIALQGPLSQSILQSMADLDLSTIKPFHCIEGVINKIPATICRTGYTGEDGFEVICPNNKSASIWLALQEKGAVQCGLGARDVLRLEAGLLLHGTDMDPTITPIEAGLQRFVRWEKKDFVGMPALHAAKATGTSQVLIGFRLLQKGIPRKDYAIQKDGDSIGIVTSGTYSPTLDMGIGLGYVSKDFSHIGTKILIDIRGKPASAEVMSIPFYTRKK